MARKKPNSFLIGLRNYFILWPVNRKQEYNPTTQEITYSWGMIPQWWSPIVWAILIIVAIIIAITEGIKGLREFITDTFIEGTPSSKTCRRKVGEPFYYKEYWTLF